MINLAQALVLISNHVNNAGSGGGEVIYSVKSKNTLPKSIANNLKAEGLPIRNVYQRTGKSGNDFYFILRNTKPTTSMIIEYGFANNDDDTKRLLNDWPNLAEAVVKAIANYENVNYTPPSYNYYKVKSGDSLYNIAKKYNLSVAELKSYNTLSNDMLYPNQILLIPKK